MAGLKLSHIYKVYPNGTKAVSDFNIDIEDCEFIVFVGPSGCGKSTTLRMIAGLEDISAGDLYIGDTLVNDIQPKDRDIAMVFQNYALYPHMTVYQNMAFALKNKHMPNDEINKRVLEAARILDIEDYLPRKPRAMSGGQRQRVALGRAIVRQPKVFLLDEPLSNLDAKLRAQMRTEITKLHKKLKTTFIYVTHDQVEAMTMGTRIVVMKKGFVQQIDTPTNLYDHPANKFVAGFIGTPQMNFFDVTIKREHEKKKVTITFEDSQTLELDEKYFSHADKKYLDGENHVTLGIRPDYLMEAKSGVKFVIKSIEALGNETLLYCTLGESQSDDDVVNSTRYIFRVNPSNHYELGQIIKGTLAGEKIQLFANSTEDEDEKTIMPYVPEYSRTVIEFKDNKYTMFGKTYPVIPEWEGVENNTYDVLVPHTSIVPGDQYELPVYEVQSLGKDKYLVTLYDEVNDTYLFAMSETKPEVGSKYKFGFKYFELEVDPASNLKPVKKVTEAIGKFIRTKQGSKIVWNLDLNGSRYTISDEIIAKVANIEGRKLLSNKYRIVFNPIVSKGGEEMTPIQKLSVLPPAIEKADDLKEGGELVLVKDGVVEQVGSKELINLHPANIEIASANPNLKTLHVTLSRKGHKVTIKDEEGNKTLVSDKYLTHLSARFLDDNTHVTLAYNEEQGIKKSVESNEFSLFSEVTGREINPFYTHYSEAKVSVKDKKVTFAGVENDCELDDGEYFVNIPSSAISIGSTYTLPVTSVERIHIASYRIGLYDKETDTYLYTTTPNPIGVGSDYHFKINWNIVTKVNDENIIPSSIRTCTVAKKKVQEVSYDGITYFVTLEEDTSVDGISVPEGYKVYHTYRTVTQEEGITHEAIKSLDFGYHKFLQVKIGDDVNDVETTDLEKADDYSIHIAKEGFEIHSLDTHIRLA